MPKVKTRSQYGRISVSISPEHDLVLTAESKETAIPKSILVRSVLAEWANKKNAARALTGAERVAIKEKAAKAKVSA